MVVNMVKSYKRGLLSIIFTFVFIISVFSGINSVVATDVVSNNNLVMNSSQTGNLYEDFNQIDPDINYESIVEESYNNEKNTNLQMQKYHSFLSKYVDDNSQEDGITQLNPKTNLYLKANSYNDWYSNPVLNIDFDKLLYKPNEPVNFIIQTTKNLGGLASQPIDVYIFDTEENFYYSIYGYFENKNNDNSGLVFQQRFTTDNDGFASGSFTPTSEGRYVLTAKFPGSSYFDFYHVITVSELGIFLRMPYYYIPGQDVSGYGLIVNASNNFSPVDSADLNLQLNTYHWGDNGYETDFGDILNLNTDENGYVYFDLPTEQNQDYWGELVVTASKGVYSSTVRRSVWSSWYYQSENTNEYVPTFDKPIYQPGEVIKGRVLVWKNSYLSATKTPLNHTSITVKLQNPSLITIRQNVIPTDENGIIDFEFPLDEDVDVGNYKISFETSTYDKQSVEIPVKFYEKPAFKVVISTEKEFITPGSSINGKIESDYYFGKPVTSAQVNIEIINPSNQEVISTKSGVSDFNGDYEFSINIPASLADTDQIQIKASVEDPVGRTVINSKTISTVSEIYVWGWVNPWLPKPDDSIKVTFYAYQTSSDYQYGWYWWWNPLPLVDAKSTVTIYGRSKSIFGSESRTEVYKEETTTNEQGLGFIEFNLDLDEILRYDDFVAVVDIDTNDGRKTSTEFSFHYAVVYVDITPTKPSYLPGEKISLDVSLKKLDGKDISGNVTIIINDAEYNTIGRGTLEIFDGKGSVELPTSTLAPQGNYYGYGFIRYIDTSDGYNSWYYYYSERFIIKVGNQVSSLSVTQSPEIVNAGDTVTLNGEVFGVSSSPILIELVKRGITSIYVVPGSNEFSIEITNTEFLAPKVTVFVFSILSSGIILEHYSTIEINQEFNAEITTDKDVYEPGDSATVSIKLTGANDKPLDAMTALTFVDGSIYGVVEDPLWEEEFFSDDQRYWPSVTTVTNWNGFQPLWWYPWYWAADGAVSIRYYGGMPNVLETFLAFGDAEAGDAQTKSPTRSTPSTEIEIRDNLPESMYWIPRLFIPKSGWDQTIVLPDNIGEWVVRLTITKGGSGAVKKASFNTQLPFFVEISKPALLMQDDIVGIKGVFYNYQDELVRANVTIDIDGVEVLGKNTQQVVIPSNFLTQVTWAVYAKEPGVFNVTVTALGEGMESGNIYSDGLRKTIRITPNGVTRTEKQSGELENGTLSSLSLNYTHYLETIDIRSSLTISPGYQNLALTGWERLVGYPYGCVEQTMSRVLPTALVYQYLLSTGELDEDTEKYFNDILTSGLSRLYSFRHYDGGFGWWHGDDSNLYMTAYVLYGLNKIIETGLKVDESIILDAAKFLLGNQAPSGKWSSDYWNIEDLPFTALIARSLSTIANETVLPNYNLSLSKSHNYIESTWNFEQSSYVAGLVLEAFYDTSYETTFENDLIQYLVDEFKDYGDGLHWSDSQTGYRALGGDVETTANALRMLATVDYSGPDPLNEIIREGIQWIILQQRQWGWRSTADTAAAIQTFIVLSNQASDAITGNVALEFNSFTDEITYSADSEPEVGHYNLKDYSVPGTNYLDINRSGDGKIFYYLSTEQVLREELELDYPSIIQGNPGETVDIPILITNPSEELVSINVNIELLNTNGETVEFQNGFFGMISDSQLINFTYKLPNNEGKLVLKGINLEYSLADVNNLFSQSSGEITSIYGPIEIEITNTPVINSYEYLKNQFGTNIRSKVSELNLVQEKDSITLERSYSKTDQFTFGETITETLSMKNTGTDSEYFLMLEDSIPVGFEVDESSLEQITSITSFKIGVSKLTFFIDELNPGSQIIINYKLVALKVYSSIAAPAKLSSMYDIWEVFTSKTTLGNVKITKNHLGVIFKDLSRPDLKMFSYEQRNDDKLTFNVEADDNDGIALVQIFYENNNDWTSVDLIHDSGDLWIGISQKLIEQNIDLFIVLHDNNGNIHTTNLQTIFIVLTVIPVITVLMILTVAVGGGIGANKIIKRKLYKD
jgi:hypothetical protein